MTSKTTKTANKASAHNRSLIILALVIFIAWLFVPLIACYIFKEASGRIGDTYNIVTSLFSAFSLLGVAIAVWYQHKGSQDAEDERKESHQRYVLASYESRLASMMQSIGDAIRTHKFAAIRYFLNPKDIDTHNGPTIHTLQHGLNYIRSMRKEVGPIQKTFEVEDSIAQSLAPLATQVFMILQFARHIPYDNVDNVLDSQTYIDQVAAVVGVDVLTTMWHFRYHTLPENASTQVATTAITKLIKRMPESIWDWVANAEGLLARYPESVSSSTTP